MGVTMDMRVLVMSSSSIGREALKSALTRSGLGTFTFAEAGSVEEARFAFDPEKTDIVFLEFDKTLAVSTAFRLVGALRVEQKRPVLIVVVAPERALEKVDLLDIDHSMVRPVQPQTIANQIGPLLKTVRAGR
jgi:DNA-binding response OmpR family regulator